MEQCVKTLAHNLKHLRKNRHFSQQYLSELSGVSRVTILHIESKKSGTVTLNTLVKLAEALEVSVGDLFTPKFPTSVRISNKMQVGCGSDGKFSGNSRGSDKEDRNAS